MSEKMRVKIIVFFSIFVALLSVFFIKMEIKSKNVSLIKIAAKQENLKAPPEASRNDNIAMNREGNYYSWLITRDGELIIWPASGYMGVISRVPLWKMEYEDSIKKIRFDGRIFLYSNRFFSDLPNLEEVNLANLSIENSLEKMFENDVSLKEIDFSNSSVMSIENMYCTFRNCSSLEKIIFGDNFNASYVKNLCRTFEGCSSLKELDLTKWGNIKEVRRMMYTFEGCSSLKTLDLSNFYTKNVDRMNNMFNNCTSLENITFSSNFKTENVFVFSSMFRNCSSLESIDLSSFKMTGGNVYLNLPSGNSAAAESVYRYTGTLYYSVEKYISGMFVGCKKLKSIDLSGFNTTKVKDMSYLFYQCEALEDINFGDYFNTSAVNDMKYMFACCKSLTKLDLSFKGKSYYSYAFRTNNVTNMEAMFNQCYNLRTLNLESFNTSNVSNMGLMFHGAGINLLTIGRDFNFKTNIQQTGGAPFGRGTWNRYEDVECKKYVGVYSIVEICDMSTKRAAAGTYRKVSNISKELNVDFPVTFKIEPINTISSFKTTEPSIFKKINENIVMNVSLNTVADSGGSWVVPGEIELLFKDVVTNENRQKYDLKMKISNIKIYDIVKIDGLDNILKEIVYLSDEKINLSNVYFKDEESLNTRKSNYPVALNEKNECIYDVSLQVVEDGAPVDGTYIFSAYDLDIPALKDEAYDVTETWGDVTRGFGKNSEGINLKTGINLSTFKKSRNSFIRNLGDDNNYVLRGSRIDTESEFSEFLVQAHANEANFQWTGDEACITIINGYYQPKLVQIEKINPQGELLSGAKLKLYYNNNNTPIAEWESSDTPKELFLMPGTYTLKEDKAPEGYNLTGDIIFYVDIDNKLVCNGRNVDLIRMVDGEGEPAPYVVKYMDADTDREISEQKEGPSLPIGSTVNANEEKEEKGEIEGYTYAYPSEEVLRINSEGNILILYYRREEDSHTPTYEIEEELSKVIVELNGATYTYQYGAPEMSAVTYMVPSLSLQTRQGYYTTQLYPSDIAYNMDNGGDKLKVYAEYNIKVKNTETRNDNIYSERKLFLNSLKNQFDDERYVLNDDKWELENEDMAVLKNIQNTEFGNTVTGGIESGGSKTTTIQFRIKDDALAYLFNIDDNRYIAENLPTIAIANGYHTYQKYIENAWVDRRSSNDIRISNALYIRLILGTPRTISGMVFLDDKNVTKTDNEGNTVNIGDGIYNNNEKIARNVKVELLNSKALDDYSTVADLSSNNNNIADLYVKDNTIIYEKKKAQTVTKDDGTYEFIGVVPGYYYLRFTYGDGTQEIWTTDGNKVDIIKLNEYRSTVINGGITNIMKEAINAGDNSKAEWYKNLNATNKYSIAVDDLNIKEKFENNIYNSDGTVENTNDDFKSMKSFSPKTLITIENVLETVSWYNNSHKPSFANFNFGITESPKTNVDIEKKVVNIDVITQVGSWMISGNPKDNNYQIMSDLDRVTEGGSKSVKIETDPQILYGGELRVTYNIEVINNSDRDYINETNVENYYYYGIIDANTRVKNVNIQELLDYLDSKFNVDTSSVIGPEGDAITISANDRIISRDVGESGGETRKAITVSITGINNIPAGKSKNIQYVAKDTLTADEDLAYYNDVELTKMKIDKLSTLQDDFEWPEDDTQLVIVPPTGKNKSTFLTINIITLLVIFSMGIFVIKNKVSVNKKNKKLNYKSKFQF